MKYKSFLSVAVLVSALASSPAFGQSACFRPFPPSCVAGRMAFEDGLMFRRCQDDVQTYVSDMDQYASCLKRENDDALREATELVARFNCKADRRTSCR